MGLGRREFAFDEVLTSANVNGYLMNQTIMVFANATARDAAIDPADTENGMFCYLTDDSSVLYVADETLEDGGWAKFATPGYSITPSWTNFTLGSLGTAVASYQFLPGKIIHYWGQVTLGSDSAFSGNIKIDVPLGNTITDRGATGGSLLNDVGTAIYVGLVHGTPGASVVDFHHAESGTNGGLVGTTAPFTWVTGDVFTWDIMIPVD